MRIVHLCIMASLRNGAIMSNTVVNAFNEISGLSNKTVFFLAMEMEFFRKHRNFPANSMLRHYVEDIFNQWAIPMERAQKMLFTHMNEVICERYTDVFSGKAMKKSRQKQKRITPSSAENISRLPLSATAA